MPGSLTVCPLASGSAGNATVVTGVGGSLLVDAGLSARELLARADEVGVSANTLCGMLITHCHTDHSRGAPVLARKLKIPIYGTRSTLRRLTGLRGSETLRPIPASGEFTLAGLQIETLGVSHDAPGTVIVRIDRRVGIATDLGMVDAKVADFIDRLEGLLLEFNHDEELLANGPYPEYLKRRILSDEGHLSNRQAVELLERPGFTPPSRALWLGHLSGENNEPGIAFDEACGALGASDADVYVVGQHEPAESVIFD